MPPFCLNLLLPEWSHGQSTCVDVVGASHFFPSPGGHLLRLGAIAREFEGSSGNMLMGVQ